MGLTKAQKKKIEELKRQDKELERLPDPKEEKGLLKRMGARLKSLVTPKKVDVKSIEQDIKEMNKALEPKDRPKKTSGKTRKTAKKK
ncbi:TPA: hypothetical protein HA265_06615 [Candidatus Woesearchaeota archaeon]|nr:hypothetical protein [Candidatus Woesearchaeota archaeon]